LGDKTKTIISHMFINAEVITCHNNALNETLSSHHLCSTRCTS